MINDKEEAGFIIEVVECISELKKAINLRLDDIDNAIENTESRYNHTPPNMLYEKYEMYREFIYKLDSAVLIPLVSKASELLTRTPNKKKYKVQKVKKKRRT